jgi:hypothetical protein
MCTRARIFVVGWLMILELELKKNTIEDTRGRGEREWCEEEGVAACAATATTTTTLPLHCRLFKQ